MYENLLPVGSVVLLKGATKRVAIIGRLQAMVDKRKVFDYAACYYPEGLLDSEKVIFFDQEDIERVYFIGFQDPEELEFRTEVLASLGELYIDENGQIVERAQDEEPAEEASDGPEPAVFADVE